MAVGPEEVRRIAALARVEVDEDRVQSLARELSGILEHVDALTEVEGRGSTVEGRDSRGRRGVEAEPGSGAPLRSDEPGGDPLGAPPSAFAPALGEGLFLVPGASGADPVRDPSSKSTSTSTSKSISNSGTHADSDSGSGASSGYAALSVTGLARAVGDGERAAVEVATGVSEAIRGRDEGAGGIHAFLGHDPALLAARAEALDEELARGRDEGRAPGRLAGVPIAIKDNLVTLDYPTTCGSRMLEGFRSPYEATVVRRLRAAGALIAGKTNLDEFAMGSSTERSAFGPTRNPHDPDRVPGGSSGGSAAAVAAGMVPAALGSDTGGSVRQPAALCGVVGLKPTYGRVSRYGLVAFASSLDQVGTFGRTVEDAAALLEVIAGHDPLDATSARRSPPELLPTLDEGVDGLVIGVPQEYFPDDLDPGVRARCDAALEALADAGAEIRPVSLPHTRLAIPAYYVVAPAEASSNLARYDGVRFGHRAEAATVTDMYRATRRQGFGEEVRRRIMLGTFVLSAGYHDRYYGHAQAVRDRIAADFDDVFASGVDVLFTPTSPTPAFRLGERTRDPVAMYRSDVFTVTANLAGIPGISVPIGTVDGLPVGGQVLGPWWREDLVVRVGRGVERASESISISISISKPGTDSHSDSGRDSGTDSHADSDSGTGTGTGSS